MWIHLDSLGNINIHLVRLESYFSLILDRLISLVAFYQLQTPLACISTHL